VVASFPFIPNDGVERPAVAKPAGEPAPVAPSLPDDAVEKDRVGADEPPRLSVVIVDDQPDFCDLIKEQPLADTEFRVGGEAHNGRQALKLVDKVRPDIVLLDIEMPDMHGTEVLVELRKRYPDIGVIMMSAHHGDDFLDEALRRGAWDLVSKAELTAQRIWEACLAVEVQRT
jgi:CheY-like chemotaxis protein